MADFKFKPWYLILAGILILALFQFRVVPFMGAAYSLTDPLTNELYYCDTTMDCYTALAITGTSAGPPALACVDTRCKFAECVDGDEDKIQCPGDKSVVVRRCNSGIWESVKATCPATECANNRDCIIGSDTDCDGELEASQTTCVDYKCTQPAISRCTEAQTFWAKYKIWVISIILIIAGLTAFLIAAPRKIKLF